MSEIENISDTIIKAKLNKPALNKIRKKYSHYISEIDIYEGIQETLSNAIRSTGISPWVYSYGHDGHDVGVYLKEGACPDPNNDFIDTNRLTVLDNFTRIGDHPTRMGIAIQETSPNLHLYCGEQWTRDDYRNFSPPIYIANHSYKTNTTNNYTAQDRDYDNDMYEDRILMTIPSGNYFENPSPSKNVTSPGKAYNALTVGSYNDANHNISTFSGYIDPDTRAEKPEVVAPGDGVAIGDFGIRIGTSISSAITAGFAANLISMNPNYFGYHPYATKAFILAGAINNIEGNQRVGDKDGVGGISYVFTGLLGAGGWWSGYNDSFFNSEHKIEFMQGDWGTSLGRFGFKQGHRYRIAIVWMVPGDYAFEHRSLNMDLDLRIEYGNTFALSSVGVDSNFEIIDFVAEHTGPHKIIIRRWQNSGHGNVLLGYAITQVTLF